MFLNNHTVAFDTSLLDDIQRQVEELELRFNEFGSHVLSQEPRNPVSPSKQLLSPTGLRGNDGDGDESD